MQEKEQKTQGRGAELLKTTEGRLLLNKDQIGMYVLNKTKDRPVYFETGLQIKITGQGHRGEFLHHKKTILLKQTVAVLQGRNGDK